MLVFAVGWPSLTQSYGGNECLRKTVDRNAGPTLTENDCFEGCCQLYHHWKWIPCVSPFPRKQTRMITESWTAGGRLGLGSGYPLTSGKRRSSCYRWIQILVLSFSVTPSLSLRYNFHYSLLNFRSALDSFQGLIHYLKFGLNVDDMCFVCLKIYYKHYSTW